MRPVVAVACVFLVLLVLAACAKPATKEQPTTIGVLLQWLKNERALTSLRMNKTINVSLILTVSNNGESVRDGYSFNGEGTSAIDLANKKGHAIVAGTSKQPTKDPQEVRYESYLVGNQAYVYDGTSWASAPLEEDYWKTKKIGLLDVAVLVAPGMVEIAGQDTLNGRKQNILELDTSHPEVRRFLLQQAVELVGFEKTGEPPIPEGQAFEGTYRVRYWVDAETYASTYSLIEVAYTSPPRQDDKGMTTVMEIKLAADEWRVDDKTPVVIDVPAEITQGKVAPLTGSVVRDAGMDLAILPLLS